MKERFVLQNNQPRLKSKRQIIQLRNQMKARILCRKPVKIQQIIRCSANCCSLFQDYLDSSESENGKKIKKNNGK